MMVSASLGPAAHPAYASRCRGALLAALCGDALGARVEGCWAWDVAKQYPDGLTSLGSKGTYTDDGQVRGRQLPGGAQVLCAPSAPLV
jgi:hypothetical protein